MKVIINAASIFKGGAEQVVNSFINECKSISEHEYFVFLCDNIYKSLDVKTFGSNFHFYRMEKRTASSVFNLLKTLWHFKQLGKKIKPDVVISTGGHGYWIPKAPLVTAFNIPHYIYSESPYFDKISLKRIIYWKLKKQFDLFFYRHSDAILVQTDDVKKRVKNILTDTDVYTVSNTINGTFLNPSFDERKLPQKKKKETRLLTVSSNYPHKNLDIIIEVVDQLLEAGIENVQFVLTLPDEAFEKYKSDKYQPFITNVGPVPIDQCPTLYHECDMMFLPTLLECFSASYVEAMAMEKPILTSDLPFARTICQAAAVYFDPMDPVDISAKIQHVIQNPDLQKELIRKGKRVYKSLNTPKERAELYLNICERKVKN